MDGNKDESEHCISLAQKYINEGDRTKALKFLYKAEKLFPSQRAKGMIIYTLNCDTFSICITTMPIARSSIIQRIF